MAVANDHPVVIVFKDIIFSEVLLLSSLIPMLPTGDNVHTLPQIGIDWEIDLKICHKK